MEAPIIRVSKAQVEIRCPYCTAKHRHGKVDGWRSSHCSKGDYYIKINKVDGGSARRNQGFSQ